VVPCPVVWWDGALKRSPKAEAPSRKLKLTHYSSDPNYLLCKSNVISLLPNNHFIAGLENNYLGQFNSFTKPRIAIDTQDGQRK